MKRIALHRVPVEDSRDRAMLLRHLRGSIGATWGFALVMAAYPWIVTRSEPGDPLSIATRLGFDPHASFRLVALALVAPFVMALVTTWVAERWRRWEPSSVVALGISVLVALWMVVELRHATSFILAIAMPPVTVALWNMRPSGVRFDGWDTLLLPMGLAIYCIMMDLTSLHWVYAVTWALGFTALLRVFLVPRITSPENQSLAVWLTPLAILPLNEHLPLGETVRALAGLIVLSVSLAAGSSLLRSKGPQTAKRWLLLAILPLFAFFYPHTQDFATADGAPRIDLFEDGHGLLPANEWLRGERPYRDMIPGHALLPDGGLDVIGILIGGDTAASALRAHHWAHGLNPLAIYLLTFAATSSAPAALTALLFSMTFLDGGTLFFRSSVPLLMLAATIAASRSGSDRWWAWSGALLPIAFLSAIEFAAYSTAVTLVALIRVSNRSQALKAFGKGVAVTASPILLVLLTFGLAVDLIHVTWGEVINLGPVYNMGPGPIPELVLREPHLPALFRPIMFRNEARHLLWPIAVIGAAAVLSSSPRRASRGEEFLLLGIWIGLAGISWAERHHTYFQFALPTFVFAAIIALWRRRHPVTRAAAITMSVMALVCQSPTRTLTDMAILRTAKAPLAPAETLVEPPRARGALFRPEDAELVRRFNALVETELRPEDTWLDLANRPILYYLFDRDCPVRQFEVPFFQPVERQEEVIRRVLRAPEVKWLIVRFGQSTIDGIPNEERVPVLAEWLNRNFQPWYDDGQIVIWKRIDSRCGTECSN